MNTAIRNTALIVALLAVIGGTVYLFTHKAAPQNGLNVSSTTPLDLSTISTTTVINTPDGSYTVTPVDDSTPAAPDYRKSISFASTVSPEVRTAINAQLKQTQDVIAGDKLNFAAWINLGVLHKIGGDYQGAAEIWRYVASIYPKSTVPLDNLAGLYMDFIKNYAKAEANLKASIALDSHDVHAYEALAELYGSYGYKTKADALAIVNQGLAANPNDATLLQLKAELSQ